MENKKRLLPENAHRELKPGEEYQPLLSPQKNYPEVTPWSVTLGIIMTLIFSAAAAYLGLKVGQVCEAAIRISPDQYLFAVPRCLTQLTTSFVASRSLGIHRPLL